MTTRSPSDLWDEDGLAIPAEPVVLTPDLPRVRWSAVAVTSEPPLGSPASADQFANQFAPWPQDDAVMAAQLAVSRQPPSSAALVADIKAAWPVVGHPLPREIEADYRPALARTDLVFRLTDGRAVLTAVGQSDIMLATSPQMLAGIIVQRVINKLNAKPPAMSIEERFARDDDDLKRRLKGTGGESLGQSGDRAGEPNSSAHRDRGQSWRV